MNKGFNYIKIIIIIIILSALTVFVNVYLITDWKITHKIIANIVEVAIFILSLIASIVTIFGKGVFANKAMDWTYCYEIAENVLNKIEKSGKSFDVVIGIGRSGGIWGGWLAGNLGSVPFYCIDIKYSVDKNGDRKIEFPFSIDVLSVILKNKKSVLIIEGAASTGATFQEFRKKHTEFFSEINFIYAVLFKNSAASISIDYVGKEVDDHWPDKFPWHYREKYQKFLKQ
jgi:hypoxanthine phosphoribosyltransferase